MSGIKKIANVENRKPGAAWSGAIRRCFEWGPEIAAAQFHSRTLFGSSYTRTRQHKSHFVSRGFKSTKTEIKLIQARNYPFVEYDMQTITVCYTVFTYVFKLECI